MNRTFYASFLLAIFALTVTSDISAAWFFGSRRVTRVYSSAPVQPISLSDFLITSGITIGLLSVVAYLCSESETQKQARLERERQRQAIIAAMTPEQREVYYAEERLKIEQQKANALQEQANAVWWNTYIAPIFYSSDPVYVEETIYY